MAAAGGAGGGGGAGLPSATSIAGGLPWSLDQVVPQQVLRSLADRSFERRKTGAQEIEKIMRKLREGGANGPLIRKALTSLANEYALSMSSNHRKGGLIALASAAIGLAGSTADYLDILIPAVLKSFGDQEARVRYYACESLFNIAKVCRQAVLRFFSDVFAGVCKLVGDSDMDVKNGAGLLDRLLKEIVMEGEVVDVERFIPLLRAHMRTTNPYVRQLLVSWITSLDTLPGVDMLDHVPQLLEGLFDMLSDGNREIRQQAYAALSVFLEQIGRVPAADFESRVAFRPMVETLISQTSREKDKFNRVTAVEWLLQLVILGQRRLAPVYHRLVAGVLRCLSDPEAEIMQEAGKTNAELMGLIRSTPVSLCEACIPHIIATVTTEVRARDRLTRSAALRWVAMMLALDPERVMAATSLLAVLLQSLVDTEDSEVLRLNLEVIARMCVYDLRFLRGRVLVDLVQLFANNRALLEAKGAFILRRLCLLLDGRIIYCALARILLHADNREFASLLVELLSLILLTAVELTDLREQLRGCCAAGSHSAAAPAAAGRGRVASSASGAGASDGTTVSGADVDKPATTLTALAPSSAGPADGSSEDEVAVVDPEDGVGVFLLLYRTWCHNPIATLALCLLTEAYELGARLVARFGETTISVGVLMQCDKLVQLLETPIFVNTRLHLTQPERPDHGHLLRSLYGLLMLMPQGTAYATLRDRLTSVTSLHIALGSAAHGGAGGRWKAPAAVGGSTSAASASLHGYGGVVGLDALAGPLHGTAAAPPASTVSPFDLDSVFSVFADSQAVYKAALREDLRSRSVLHRYNTLQAQLGANAAASAAAVAVATAASSAAGVMGALPGPVGAGDSAVGLAGGDGAGMAAAAAGQARRGAPGAVPSSAVKAAGGAAQAPALLALGEAPEAADAAAAEGAPLAAPDAGADVEAEEAAPSEGAIAALGASGHLLLHQRSLRDELRGLGVASPAARTGRSGSAAGDLTPSPAPDTPLPGAAAATLAAAGAPGANGGEVGSRAGTESEGSSSDEEEGRNQ